ncbi:helix-turn-helix domain-containing protein [Pseudonocardia humida]|uniref:Helix-turn-helix transcriptional regulator n=1 Tax=Pseudonocardia humida TaxID=2800819 RepID=A0ABT1A308_9PSEU|nr:helix-turn-helix transcriptional regulator [Pseudonocardia humida]MCO1657382.1 helix-turn-helix transcriptional regulator [Pseudonocardia humida]
MGGRSGSQVRRRVLARELRGLREAAGLTLDEAAATLDVAPSTLSRSESGQQQISVHVVKSMLDVYGADDRWDELLRLARASRQRGWWQAFGLGERTHLVGLETEATRVREFTPNYLPGLLQTADYARALFVAAGVWGSGASLENAVAVRMIRQERLVDADEPLHLDAIIDESALHRPIGGPAVHRAQLARLLVAAGLPTVTLQVLPLSVGAHPALASPLTLLSFGDLGEPDIAYVEHTLGAVTMDKTPDVERARVCFDRLRTEAAGLADSLALLRGALDRAG